MKVVLRWTLGSEEGRTLGCCGSVCCALFHLQELDEQFFLPLANYLESTSIATPNTFNPRRSI
jgi:hypothetical protein